jgi:hypothetical protein
MAKRLYRFNLYCGRMGSLHGLFTADESEIVDAIGKRVNFGEALGKHSDVSCTLDAGHFEALTDDADFIAKFDQFRCASGPNPLRRLREE